MGFWSNMLFLWRTEQRRAAGINMVGEVGSNLRRRKPADLQSAPFATRDTPPDVSQSLAGREEMAIARAGGQFRGPWLWWRDNAVSTAGKAGFSGPGRRCGPTVQGVRGTSAIRNSP